MLPYRKNCESSRDSWFVPRSYGSQIGRLAPSSLATSGDEPLWGGVGLRDASLNGDPRLGWNRNWSSVDFKEGSSTNDGGDCYPLTSQPVEAAARTCTAPMRLPRPMPQLMPVPGFTNYHIIPGGRKKQADRGPVASRVLSQNDALGGARPEWALPDYAGGSAKPSEAIISDGDWTRKAAVRTKLQAPQGPPPPRPQRYDLKLRFANPATVQIGDGRWAADAATSPYVSIPHRPPPPLLRQGLERVFPYWRNASVVPLGSANRANVDVDESSLGATTTHHAEAFPPYPASFYAGVPTRIAAAAAAKRGNLGSGHLLVAMHNASSAAVLRDPHNGGDPTALDGRGSLATVAHSRELRRPIVAQQNPLKRYEKGAEFLEGKRVLQPVPPKIAEGSLDDSWMRKKKFERSHAPTYLL